MTRPNGTAKWIGILVSAVVAAVSITYAMATDTVTVVAARLESTCERVNRLEQGEAELRTDVKYLIRMSDQMNKKLDKALEK